MVLRWGRLRGPGDVWRGLKTFSGALMGVLLASRGAGRGCYSTPCRAQHSTAGSSAAIRQGRPEPRRWRCFAGVGTRHSPFRFFPLRWESLSSACPTAVFWRHVICLVAQIHSQRGICQEESYLDSAMSDVERVWRTLWALGVRVDPVMS